MLKDRLELLNLNADQKLKSSLILSQSGDFNTAAAILITSFEERSKVVLIQLIDLGIPINLETKSIKILFRNHDYRSYIGYFIDCFYEIINDLKKVIEILFEDEKYKMRVLNFTADLEIQKIFINWLGEKIDSFINKTSFYKELQITRQSTLYIDLDNLSQFSVSENEFYELKKKLDIVNTLASDLNYIKRISNELSINESLINLFNEEVLKNLLSAIDNIRKKKMKNFDNIEIELVKMKNSLGLY